MSCSKIIVLFACLMYAEVVIFGQAAMWHFGNIESLPEMWVNIVPPIIAIIAYFAKSAVENRKGGIVYDSALREDEDDE